MVQQEGTQLLWGGVYRQHQLLGQTARQLTRQELQIEQENRWLTITNRWKHLSRNKDCLVIGDLNLDYLRWGLPEPHLEAMVDRVKDTLETSGFSQLIETHTRTWRTHVDSLLDHVWTNCPAKIVKVYNTTRASSDHNIIGVELAINGIKSGGNNVLKREWKNFDREKCLQEFRDTNWNEVLDENELNAANKLLEDKVVGIMDRNAPMKITQCRKNYKCYLSEETKSEMKIRDLSREKAKLTDNENDWNEFKIRRNSCTTRQRNDRSNYLKDLYKKIEDERDTSKLFTTTKMLLGLKSQGPPSCFN